MLIPHLNPGGVVLLDDARRPNEQHAVSRWLEELPGLSGEFLNHEKGCAIVSKAVGSP